MGRKRSTVDLASYVGLEAKAFGRLVRSERIRMGVSMGDAAARSGIAYIQYLQIETGRRLPSYPTLHRIVNTLGYDPAVLLSHPDTSCEAESA